MDDRMAKENRSENLIANSVSILGKIFLQIVVMGNDSYDDLHY